MVAFVFSIIITVVLALAIIPVAKRRPVGTPVTWGEAMFASLYVFALLFLAYGVVPHQWLTWADSELRWRSDKLLFGPGDILKPKAYGGYFPFTMNWKHIRDIVAAGIYGVFFGGQVVVWGVWQRRGSKASTEVAVSTYGRPLARKV